MRSASLRPENRVADLTEASKFQNRICSDLTCWLEQEASMDGKTLCYLFPCDDYALAQLAQLRVEIGCQFVAVPLIDQGLDGPDWADLRV